MGLTGTRTYVGFGFGAIQAGLFLYEAFQSGHFGRLVVGEIDPGTVADLRGAKGFYSVNIAHRDGIENARVGPVEVYNPTVAGDREQLVEAIADAEEMGTAIPSVELYQTEGPGSLHRVLAEGLVRKARESGPRAVVYAAENHNEAAEILERLVMGEVPVERRDEVRGIVQFLNTVIGKMSGLVGDPAASGLMTVTATSSQAFLVEEFNRILISRIRLKPRFERGISVFEEKEELLPFEEAKLYGHNATHALTAYLGRMAGVRRMTELGSVPGLIEFVREAFLEESGRALIRKHAGVDRLFTPEGYREYAEDLIERMTNPNLMDTVERVGRDPQRKLGWDDRLIGTMRLVRSMGIEARRYGIGAAAGFAALDSRFLEDNAPAGQLAEPLWRSGRIEPAEREDMLLLIEKGRDFLRLWRRLGLADPSQLLAEMQGP